MGVRPRPSQKAHAHNPKTPQISREWYSTRTSNQMFLTARGMEATGVLAATTTSRSGAWKPRPRFSTIWW